MRLPRDLSGDELATLLRRRYQYQTSRQTGDHLRLTSTFTGTEHHVTIPRHHELKVGTLSAIVTDVAHYLGIDREALAADLFGS